MLELVIGNKNYSSWSMRPWVLMKHFGIGFTERRLRLDFDAGSPFRAEVAKVSPAGRVPVLLDDGFAVWDTLAITEYLAERFPAHAIWPRDTKARARARSLAAEMHAGFGALRSAWPQNIEASLPEAGARVLAEQPAVTKDLDRLFSMWTEAPAASGGPFLFGEFSAVDAFYAPVIGRLRTYGVALPPAVQAYADRVWALPAVAAFVAEALEERDFIVEDEPYRTSRD